MKSPCQETLERYLRLRSATLSPVTTRRYRRNITLFIEFLHRHHPEVDSFSKLERTPHLEGWLKMLASAAPPYTDGTRALLIYQVRRFFKDLHQWGWSESPPREVIRGEDIPTCERPLSPRRRLKVLARRLRIFPDALALDPWNRILEEYLSARSASLEPGSAASYRVSILSLVEFLRRRFPEVDSPSRLKRDPHIEGWLHALSQARSYKTSTLRGYIGLVGRFLEDLHRWNWPECPPSRLIDSKDLPRDPPSSPPRNRLLSLIGAPADPRGDPPPDTALHGTLKRYLDVRSATVRPGTLNHYRLSVRSLIHFLQNRFPEFDSFAKLRRDPHVEAWLQGLAGVQPPYRNGTRRERIRTVLRFLEDLYDWGWPDAPPPGLIRLDDFPPCDHYLAKPLPPDVDAILMEALKREGGFVSLGLVLARRTGLRIGELCRLELDCLQENPPGGYSLRVPLGKLRSERVIPVERDTAELITALKGLRAERPCVMDPETGRNVEALFCDQAGHFIQGNVFYKKLRSVAQSAGITQNVHPHRLRHTYATELLRNGLSLPGVMKLLGHKTLKMTLRYVEVTNEDLGRDYLKAMERARQRYSALRALDSPEAADQQGSVETVEHAFDRLVSRIQALRFDRSDPRDRKRLQRFVERLRRAQSDLPDLLR